MASYGIGKTILLRKRGTRSACAGYHLAQAKCLCLYAEQREGNIINPVASLMNDKVYGIPCIFIVGWRGEPGVHDEPQHIYQGEVTVKLLENMDISTFVISKDTTEDELNDKMTEFKPLLVRGKQVAFVIRKGALEFDGKVKYENGNTMLREEIIRHITAVSGRIQSFRRPVRRTELFEIRRQTTGTR